MVYRIEVTPAADDDLAGMKAFHRTEVLDAIDEHLTHTPTIVSKSRVKRLRLPDSPTYRLRVGDYRVYYDVDVTLSTVIVLRILSKAASLDYLQDIGGKE
jgi:mRNA-degrading endonuclease RelE of RelBE toxin-antitoxin system